jgi:U3 small nucleolar RNA-associated protein MPP10
MATRMSSRANGSAQAIPAMSLLGTLETSLQNFLPASSSLHDAAILAAKQFLDPLAQDVARAQELRRTENRKKRKRGQHESDGQILQIREVYTDGFGANQIWEQARRVTDAAAEEIQKDLERLQLLLRDVNNQHDEPKTNGHGPVKMVRFDEEGFEVDSDELQDEEDALDEILEDGADDYEDEDEDEEDAGVALEDIEEKDDIDMLSEDEAKVETFVPDPNNLNDGFFSIDDFNKQSQFLEQKDARGEDDNPSDEDEIDWDADPLSLPLPKSRKEDMGEDDTADSDEEDDGPTFGDPDAPSEDDLDEDADMGDNMPGLGNTNDIQYADFFEPPPKRPSKTKRMRALPKTQPTPGSAAENVEDVQNDIQRAMADVRRDLLDSDLEESDSEASASGSDRPKKAKNLSTHEKQKAAIAAEIRKLEAAAVAKRDWTLSGEARAADRPVNSLIEEDLEFERAGKPVPVVTAEVSEGIEALIKRRIIAREFDEVVRRRPEALGAANETRRGRVELNDSQSKAGLAEIYEQEHLARSDPAYESTLDKKTKKAHAEIDALWRDVSAQLDVLSNLHFKPKRAEVEIKAVEDKPTIRMEDARPGGLAGEENMLAPQEIFRPGERKEDHVIVRKSGASTNKEEMTREEKLRRRRREKERVKKRGGNVDQTDVGVRKDANGKPGRKSRKDEKSDILSDLKKGNVKVIGKKGLLEEINPKAGRRKAGEVGGAGSSAGFKL